ncbi:MAG: TIGR02996 domain-containing protein [Gemmataceae bacterium]
MEQGFLDALRDDPDDRVNHLVFADWLDDHGHAGRAEYIRAWWRIQALPPRERAAAHEDVRQAHRPAFHRWLGEPSHSGVIADFGGAVVARLRVDRGVSPSLVARLLDRHPVRELTIGRLPTAAELARLPAFRHVRGLDFQGGDCDDFFLWPYLPPLRRLTLGHLSTSTARLLAVTPGLRSLRSIGGPASNLDDAGVVALLKSPHLGGLEEWHLTGDRVTPLSLLHLFRNGRARKWRALTYANELADVTDLDPIGGCERLERLTLAVPGVPSDDRLRCLAPLMRLRELTLTGRLGSPDIAWLAAWPGLRRLESLKARPQYSLTEGSYQPILLSPHRDPETILDLPGVTP